MPPRRDRRTPDEQSLDRDYVVGFVIDWHETRTAKHVKLVFTARSPQMAIHRALLEMEFMERPAKMTSLSEAKDEVGVIGRCSSCGHVILSNEKKDGRGIATRC